MNKWERVDEAVEQVTENAGEYFQRCYYEFAVKWVKNTNDPEWFISEHIRRAYEAADESVEAPHPHDWRAVAGIIKRLVEEDIIEAVPTFAKDSTGAPKQVWRRVND